MADFDDLYQQVILDHNRNPRNFRKLEDADRTAEGYNPLCGDHYTFYLKRADGKISEVSFQGSGCAISKASASVMTSMVKGKTTEEAEKLIGSFRDVVMSQQNLSEEELEKLGRLAAFAGVREFPSRVKCAVLAWHTLHGALQGEEKVSTE